MNQREKEYRNRHHTSAVSGLAPVEFHHCIYDRMKAVPELNCPENLMPLTHDEHERIGSMGYEGRCWAWRMKCAEFGHNHMERWHRELPLKSKENFE
jgi:hypothetical protein